jgi:oxidoreductase family protein
MTSPEKKAILAKPIPPADDDCCGGGACNPCVWDHYYAQLQKWRIEQAQLKELALKAQENDQSR